jgi:hypothetical protein
MGTLLGAVLLFLLVVSRGQTCTRDSYTSLPPAPAFPSATYTGTMGASSSYVQNHWSEIATLLRPKNTVVTDQTLCPHLAGDLLDWHSGKAKFSCQCVIIRRSDLGWQGSSC